MTFTISPKVTVTEIDASTGIPAVSTTVAALAGVFRWGPVGKIVLTTSEPDLVTKFHKPTNLNPETWFTAANFLAYGNQLNIVRVTDGTNALAVFPGTTAPVANTQTILNADVYNSNTVVFSANVAYLAKYPGDLGNTLRVSVCDSNTAYFSAIPLVANSDIAPSSNIAFTVGSNVATVTIGFTGGGSQGEANTQAYAVAAQLQVGDNLFVGNTSIGTQYIPISALGSITGNSTVATFNINLASPYRLRSAWSSNTVSRFWEFFKQVIVAPGTSQYVSQFGNTSAQDTIHVVVVDDGGVISGSPGTILEVFKGMSRATDAKAQDGSALYYKTVINTQSQWIWWANDRAGAASANAALVISANTATPLNMRMQVGSDGSNEATISLSNILGGYDMFKDPALVDVELVLAGKARDGDGVTHVNYLIDNLGENRKDCVVFASPTNASVVNNIGGEHDAVIAFANALRPSSYGFLDSGYMYQYDKYNDIYRWIPLNGSIAGLAARTDQTNDAWWSFAGYNRGQILNVVKLAYNPPVGARDDLSKASVNAVISEIGNGVFLFDDRTLLKVDSAFRAINVRRLFIVLEKAIATDAKYMMFEFNDDFTRASFRNRVIPYLRDIQGRRGIEDFQVVCDSTNNTDTVIANAQFVGDLYIKPARAIRGIQLNFVAVRNDVSFSEIVGTF